MTGENWLDAPLGIARQTVNGAVGRDGRKEMQMRAAQLPELWEWAEYY
jgi:hypothetical protein